MDINTLIFLLAITTITFVVIRFFARRKKKETIEPVGMTELGFSALPDPDPSLLLQINQLHQKYPSQDLILHDVFTKKQDEIEYFLFDIQDRSGKEPSILAQDVITLSFPVLKLPRMTILSRSVNKGFAGFLTDRFVSRIANWENLQDLKMITFADHPNLDRRYFFFCVDVGQVKEFLTEPRLSFFLKQTSSYVFETNQNILTVHLTSNPPNLSRQARIQLTISTALEMVKLFTN